jgi:steroid 5-alpha reductase family enzyme
MDIWITSLVTVLALMSALWVVSLIVRDASIVDIFWGLGFVVIAWIGYASAPGSRALLVSLLVSAWGLRLAGHLARRNLGRGEDYRYREMRQHHGRAFRWVSFGTVFMLQGLLMWVISWPVQFVAARSPQSIGGLDVVATAVCVAGLLFEAIADAQLARFRRRGRDGSTGVMDQGLWRYSRHPNYFGDAVVWWGFGLFGVAAGGWWTLAGPALMTVLLLRVSGVSLLERTIADRRPAYHAYAARTSAFVPWFPKQS